MVNTKMTLNLLDDRIRTKDYKSAVGMLNDQQYEGFFQKSYSDVIQEVLLKRMKDSEEAECYQTCESMLKELAVRCHKEGILFEFLETIETVKDDEIFGSILKCLQVILLSQSEKKSRALEYCLNSVEDYVLELPTPELMKNAEDEEERILENDEEVRRILMMYVTLDLFYEPLVYQILENGKLKDEQQIFRSNKFNRRNVLLCFVLRLLGKPLSLLDLTHDESFRKVTSYSRQVATSLATTICQLNSDIFRLLTYAEIRNRWPSKLQTDANETSDIFLFKEKAPLVQIGVLLYLIVTEKVAGQNLPKVYRNEFLLMKGIYVVNATMTAEDSVVNKGLKLFNSLLDNCSGLKISSNELEEDIHREFCGNLVQTLLFSPQKRNRSLSLEVIRKYILLFDDQGRYTLITKILEISSHDGLLGYLTTLYKNFIFDDLKSDVMTDFTSGFNLKHLVLQFFCNLRGDLSLQRSRLLISASGVKLSSQVNLQNNVRTITTTLKSLNHDKKNIETFRAREEKREEEFNKQSTESSDTKPEVEQEDLELTAIKKKILEAALQNIAADGWTRNAIIKGAEVSGYPGTVHGMFPKGGIELVNYFNLKCNKELVELMKEKVGEKSDKVGVPTEFVCWAMQQRLQMLDPYIKYWPQALAIMSLPPNVPTSIANMLTLVDDICYYTGDRSVDFNWYARRIGLATIYKATELFMLQDSAPYDRTWKFLERRVSDAAIVQDILLQSENSTKHISEALTSLITTSRNILGLNYDRK